MATVRNTKLEEFGLTEELYSLQGAKDCAVYQKATETCLIFEADISEELRTLGGPEAVAGNFVKAADDFYRVQAPVVPIALFAFMILGFVALAYYLGGRKVLRCSLAETVRDDTMV